MNMQEFDIQLTLERALEKFPNILNKSKSIENILMVCLTPHENLRIFTGKILWRSIVANNTLNKYSKKYGAKHVYLLNFNIFQFALGIFRPNYLIVGILFRPFSRMDKSSLIKKVEYFRKVIQTWFF